MGKRLAMRRYPRKPFAAAVITSSPAWERPLVLQAVNLSHGGVFLACDRAIEAGTEVWLDIPLGPEAALGLTGTVAHVVSAERASLDGHVWGFGVRFEVLDATRSALLDELLETLPAATVVAASSAAPSDRAALEAELGRLHELRPWQILEISPDATAEQAAAAYRDLIQRYHPDAFAARLPIELHGLATDCFLAVRRAYEQFRNPQPPVAEPVPITNERRRTTTRGVPIHVSTPVPRRAPRSFSVPETLSPRTGATPPAVPILVQAAPASAPTPVSPSPSAQRVIESALAAYEREDYHDARTQLAAALRAQPRNRALLGAFYVALGFDLLAQARTDDAAASFQRALLCDGQNERAVAALRAITRNRTAQRRSRFAKLMGSE
jgi:tetratricopeptide (TPR) repeat protein